VGVKSRGSGGGAIEVILSFFKKICSFKYAWSSPPLLHHCNVANTSTYKAEVLTNINNTRMGVSREGKKAGLDSHTWYW